MNAQLSAQLQHDNACDCCGPEAAEWAAYQEWSGDLPDDIARDHFADFLHSLDMFAQFEEWQFSKRYPRADR